ncbi:MAG: hypothetical protein U5K79_07115 [Cyclobacteriaceae bacterium]|nr:hypothetical protein [Cyclobacteriaceae bacterium]
MARDTGDWFSGVVILNNLEILTGELKISGKYDAVQVIVYGAIRTIPAREIVKVSFHDPSVNCVRTLITTSSGKSKGHIGFYEVLIHGEVSLLASYQHYNRFDGASKLLSDNTVEIPEDMQLYFYDGKTVIASRNFRKQVYPAFMNVFGDDLTDYIKSHRVRLEDALGQIMLLQRFNLLYAKSKLLAID